MKVSKFLLTAVAAGALITSGAAYAEHHEGKDGGHKGHHKAKMFEKMDTDGDGQISKAEHMAGAEERFAKMDTNGDGFVTKEEVETKMKDMRAKWKEHKKEKATSDDTSVE